MTFQVIQDVCENIADDCESIPEGFRARARPPMTWRSVRDRLELRGAAKSHREPPGDLRILRLPYKVAKPSGHASGGPWRLKAADPGAVQRRRTPLQVTRGYARARKPSGITRNHPRSCHKHPGALGRPWRRPTRAQVPPKKNGHLYSMSKFLEGHGF